MAEIENDELEAKMSNAFAWDVEKQLCSDYQPHFEQIGNDRFKLTYHSPYVAHQHNLSVVGMFPSLAVSEEMEVILILPESIPLKLLVNFLNLIMKCGETWEHPIVVKNVKEME